MLVREIKHEFTIDCDTGNICCRFLLGSNITKKYYNKNNVEQTLKGFCSWLYHDMIVNYNKRKRRADWILGYNVHLQYVASGYINRQSISILQWRITYDRRVNWSKYYEQNNLCLKVLFDSEL